MRKYVPLLFLTLLGCQASPTPAPVTMTPAAIAPPVLPPDLALERKVRQQAQYIEALISQNEALAARLNAAPDGAPYPSPVARALTQPLNRPPVLAETPQTLKAPDSPVLMPNAEGIIDLAASLVALKSDEPVNPFTVRTVPVESVREVSLEVGGIVAGPVACAVINDHLVQAGDAIESLAVERIESDGVILKHGSQRMRLPVGGKNLRVRLPI